jgi:hypothetical protein
MNTFAKGMLQFDAFPSPARFKIGVGGAHATAQKVWSSVGKSMWAAIDATQKGLNGHTA